MTTNLERLILAVFAAIFGMVFVRAVSVSVGIDGGALIIVASGMLSAVVAWRRAEDIAAWMERR